ncbi:oligoendopeptidase [Carnobacterium divergens]|uniref:M3 family oligoendopeptidase n=1 Tax=Carnobacterium divergens TaxID=2748 RepID=UPI001071F6CA|nr:M3 family oligoendopeptidase [Carnobacterium divergens]MDT1995480.1 M3 family oligoendopeptidase [Carnobacterium divergens]TFI62123.1 oligoendopeptidase [Carnobacterium divergens]TFI62221.1 oligoendopeptidase [Carnobacterium divergens]TFI66261.1 oligoendopeptidase [Carnobacterium divergens]TFI77683.1 oligoendopeptidase [Carnobacterium divergens]
MTYHINWDLDSIFPGGSTSAALQEKITLLHTQLEELTTQVQAWEFNQDQPNTSQFSAILALEEKISMGLTQAFSFIEAVQSADVSDKNAGTVTGQLLELNSQFQTIHTILVKKLVLISENKWQEMLQIPSFKAIAFSLNETREDGKELLSEAEEALINALSIDGFQGWSDHYDSLVATIEIPFEEKDGSVSPLSAGQAFNKMSDDPDSAVRKQLFKKWEDAWTKKAPLFADTLNHLAGFRLANYKAHHTTDFLKKPLRYNRMKKETLDAMWQAVSDHKKPFVDYLNQKAKLFGKTQLSWEDIDAPVIIGSNKPQVYPFDQGADFIVANFRKFSTKMADFAQYAFDHSWIEAEDRSGKRPGGYCTGFPESKESRIFMTYSESPSDVSTLAHELGHAFHSDVMKDLPILNQDYAMNVAETASTFAEMIVADATVKEATTTEEKIMLLDTKISSSIAMFLNIHARFIFESNFYKERQAGIVSEERISELMEEAQKEAFQDSLSQYHPHFWASKLHFFISDVPFYNFPYTFGYLFSLGIYARSLEEGADFEDKYIALLKDTASMTTEELAMKHLDVDLTKSDFWVAGIKLMEADVQEFIELTNNL